MKTEQEIQEAHDLFLVESDRALRGDFTSQVIVATLLNGTCWVLGHGTECMKNQPDINGDIIDWDAEGRVLPDLQQLIDELREERDEDSRGSTESA